MKKKNLIPIGVILLPFLILLALFIISPIANNISAQNVQQDLESLPLPEETVFCEGVSAAGKFVGNGNGIQLFGGILIKSKLSIMELNDHYDAYRKTGQDIRVVQQTSAEIKVEDAYFGEPVYFKTLKEEKDTAGYYIVYVWGEGSPVFSGFDLRGH